MKRKIIVTLVFLFFFWVIYGSLITSASSPVEQVVLVLWHGLEWEQIHDFQYEGPIAYGLMNTRFGGGSTVSGAYLSVGAGARAVGYAGAEVFLQGEEAHKLFVLNTGLKPSYVVQPQIALINAAQTVNYTVLPGALGAAFSEVNLPIRALGNSDGVEPARWSALVAMDQYGRVWEGDVSESLLIKDPSYPFGMRTDYKILKDRVLQSTEPLVVVDLGDPFRYAQYEKSLVFTQQIKLQERMVAEAKTFLQDVVREKPSTTAFLVLSPYPSEIKATQGYWLTPVILVGQNKGLLISGTTRWPGLITNMDIAPTILEFIGIEHAQPFIGRPASVQGQEQAQDYVAHMQSRIQKVSYHRSFVLRTMVISQIIIYTCALILLIINSSPITRMVRFLQFFLFIFLVMPLVLLLWNGPLLILLALILGIILFSVRYYHQSLPKVGVIALSTAVMIILDVLTGSWLMRYSYLGYDPIGGARFYGLGNELMGVLVGATIIGWAVLCEKIDFPERLRNLLGLFIFGTVVGVIGAPTLGTNVGGAICAVFAFGSTWLAFRAVEVSWRSVLLLFVAVGLVLGILMFVDYANPSTEQSHIGQTVRLFGRDGFKALQLIIVRKLTMNFKLMRYSIWSKALVVAIVVMGASFIWPSKFTVWLKKTHPFIAKGMGGVVIGSVAALVFNDSGVVAAATCLYFASTTLLLFALELKHNFDAP